MNATGKRRLLKLADFLESGVPPKRFNMDLWGDGNERGTPACGTVACALGWASAVPSLRRAGVELRHSGSPSWSEFTGGSPRSVGRHVFDMTDDQFTDIFAPPDTHLLRGKRALGVVARRIRKLVGAAS